MNLQQIEYFVRVAELGSFTRAAALLDVSQPTLSRHVRQLELELRTHLLLRNGRGVDLTEAGKSLLSYGNAIMELTRQAADDIQSLRESPTGRLSVGLPPRVATVFTRQLVQWFRGQFPEASISISEGLSMSLREMLILGQVELALLFDPQPNPRLEFLSLFREDLVLYGKPSRQLPLPRQLAAVKLPAYPVIVPSMPHAIRAVVEAALRPIGVQLTVVAEVDAVHSAVELAATGLGFAIVPRSAIARSLAGAAPLKASQVVSPRLLNHLTLAWSKARPLSRLGRTTVEFIRAQDLGALLDSSA